MDFGVIFETALHKYIPIDTLSSTLDFGFTCKSLSSTQYNINYEFYTSSNVSNVRLT